MKISSDSGEGWRGLLASDYVDPRDLKPTSPLRALLKFGGLLDLSVPGPEKVELARAAQPSPDARHLAQERVRRLLDACDTATDDGVRARALLEFMLASGCRVSEVIGLERRQL